MFIYIASGTNVSSLYSERYACCRRNTREDYQRIDMLP